ncbi:MAG: hypothetical protein PHQ43_11015 [Dehalococcoidales bacterium]|jgi:hypothetical protein|nr:hypothetical protein [Dehalococcoidales bacterium]
MLTNLQLGFWNILPSTQGKVIHVKPYSGSDDNPGDSPTMAFKTLAKALSEATADKNDIVLLYAESNTSASTTDYQSAALDWNKDLVHLIGVGAPTAVSQRARIANTAGANISPVVKFSADGCIVANVQIVNGDNNAAALLAAEVTGQRNYFKGVHFAGIVGGTTQSAAGAADLKINGGAENVFDSCTIGVDTIARDADATGILFDTNATRNMFRDCVIQAYLSAAGYAHAIIADGTGIDRWQIFKNCLFMAKSTNKAITQSVVFTIPVISQGAIVLMDSYAFSDGGAVAWSAAKGIVWNNSVAAAATAGGGIMSNL